MTLEHELTQRELDAMNEENKGTPYHRIHAVAERCLFGLFDAALRYDGVK